jgi:hypothetical protein
LLLALKAGATELEGSLAKESSDNAGDELVWDISTGVMSARWSDTYGMEIGSKRLDQVFSRASPIMETINKLVQISRKVVEGSKDIGSKKATSR